MSTKAVAWVLEHSPYTLGSRLVHIVLADKVNDVHDYELWMKQADIARLAGLGIRQVARILQQMVAEGWLELLEEGRGRGKATRFRMVLKTPHFVGLTESKPDKECIENPTLAEDTVSSQITNPITSPRKTRINDSFAPSTRLLTWARENHSSVDIVRETQQFVDHHAARGTTMLDWDRAWQTWIRNAERWAPRQNGNTGKDDPDTAWLAEQAEMKLHNQ